MTDELVITSDLELLDELNEAEASAITFDICPECGIDMVVTVGHCKTCLVCGWSLCAL